MRPAETAWHHRNWMSFPCEGYTLGTDPESAEGGRRTWSAVAHAIAEFEPVTMLVDPSARGGRPPPPLISHRNRRDPFAEYWTRDDRRLGALDPALDGGRR